MLFFAKASGNVVAAFGFKLNEDNKLELVSVGVYFLKMMTFTAMEKITL